MIEVQFERVLENGPVQRTQKVSAHSPEISVHRWLWMSGQVCLTRSWFLSEYFLCRWESESIHSCHYNASVYSSFTCTEICETCERGMSNITSEFKFLLTYTEHLIQLSVVFCVGNCVSGSPCLFRVSVSWYWKQSPWSCGCTLICWRPWSSSHTQSAGRKTQTSHVDLCTNTKFSRYGETQYRVFIWLQNLHRDPRGSCF